MAEAEAEAANGGARGVPASRAEGHAQRVERADRLHPAPEFFVGRRVARVAPQIIRPRTGQPPYYYVLMGASLCPEALGDTDADGRVVACRDPPVVVGTVAFESVSTSSDVGPPYAVAVACTCPDWKFRSGLDPQRKDVGYALSDRERDAGIGCKHMIMCNQDLLGAQPGQLEAAARAEDDRAAFLAEAPPPDPYGDVGPLL